MNNEFISIMTDRIVREFDPLQIILFGSQARGDADRDSDIDMLVVFAELTDKRKTAIDIGRALSDVPVAMDILQIDFRRTHDLNVLRDLLPESWQLKTAPSNLKDLNRWAVEARYPEDMQGTTETDASEAVEQARSIWTSVSTALAAHGYLEE